MMTVQDLGINVPVEEKKEEKTSKAIYNRKVLANVPAHMKTTYCEATDCDIYSAGGIMGFKTSSKNGITFAGYDSAQEAFNVIRQMAKLEIYGNWNIVQVIETGKFLVVPAMKYSK